MNILQRHPYWAIVLVVLLIVLIWLVGFGGLGGYTNGQEIVP